MAVGKVDMRIVFAYLGIITLAVSIFILDLNIEKGWAVWLPYVILVLISFKSPNNTFRFLIPVLCSIFIILGFFYSLKGIEKDIVLFNQTIGIITIWIVFVISSMRKLAENELYWSEERYRSIVSDQIDIISRFRKNGTYTFVNDAYCQFFNKQREELLDKKWHPNYVQDNLAEREKQLQTLSLSKPIFETEDCIFSNDNQLQWFQFIYRGFFDSGGKLLEIQSVGRNITKLKEIENKLQERNEELLILNKEKDKFLSIIAHDLKSPFQGFIGITEIMANEINTFTTEELSEIAINLEKSAKDLFGLIENLLEWAQMQKGDINYVPQEFDLFNIAQNGIEIMKYRAMQKEIKLINEVSQNQKVFADEKMVNTIFRNLLSNAIKFTKKEGKIIVRSKKLDNNKVEISVCDTGIGIAENDLKKLFRIDEKLNHLGTEGETSTGLGLLLCKGFVEKNKGDIWVESLENIGSTFYFTLQSADINNL
jgi:PAS domain S-box-containing protein